MNLCVIPARGGSKRIPRKNIKIFCGLPIIAWSIRAAKDSKCFDRIVVSTDDEEIARVASEYGAEAPFVRPEDLSNDHAATVPVIAHAIRWFTDRGEVYSDVCCLYATAPFIESTTIQKGLSLLQNADINYVFPVAPFASRIQRALRITASGRAQMFFPDQLNTRSQDLENAYHDAGQFYWGRAKAWVRGDAIFSENSIPMILPRSKVLDIDTPEDWAIAEMMFQKVPHADLGEN